MKYKHVNRKLNRQVNGELALADPTPATVDGTRSLVERFYAMKKNASCQPEKKHLAPRHPNENNPPPTARNFSTSVEPTARKVTPSKAKNRTASEYGVQTTVSRPVARVVRNRTLPSRTFAEDQGDSSSPSFSQTWLSGKPVVGVDVAVKPPFKNPTTSVGGGEGPEDEAEGAD